MNFIMANNLKIIAVFLLAIVLVSCGGSSSESVPVTDRLSSPSIDGPSTGAATLRWLPPTTNEDSSTLEDLAGYKIYYGTSSDSLPNVITINNPGLSAYVVEGLAENVIYYFAIKAIDFSGNESVFSNIVSKYIQS